MDTTHQADQPTAQDRPRQPLDFFRRLHKQPIRVKCLSGQVIKGTLKAFNPYDLLIEVENGEEIILPKHAILFVAGPGPKEEAA